jgi:hypothetical protein
VLRLALPRHSILLSLLLLQLLLPDRLHGLQHCLNAQDVRQQLHEQDVRQQLRSLSALRLRLMLVAARCSYALCMSLPSWHTPLLVLAAASDGGAPPAPAAAPAAGGGAAVGYPYRHGRTPNWIPLVSQQQSLLRCCHPAQQPPLLLPVLLLSTS